MRRVQDLFDLILRTAQADERIRAVILNGLRVNAQASEDLFQDFDVVYLVTNFEVFRDDLDGISRFGERMILQMKARPGSLLVRWLPASRRLVP